ncbi:hypothetical protein L4C34_06335 [Vibrio profundum]|uniref:hypothetical protein n=1 Tax=Vibrio profundum TaxID=2910247 RepID=UPI003D0E0998
MYTNLRTLLILILGILLTACSLANRQPGADQKFIARTGAAGSLHGPHYIARMLVTDTNGWVTGLGYGAVNGEALALADIAIGVPKAIQGYWKKESGRGDYYKINGKVNSKLASEKVKALQQYYKNYHQGGMLAVTVDGPHVSLYYTLSCSPLYDDCTPRENADPNHYIVHSKKYGTNRVVLFSGVGFASKTAFPNTPFDKRMVDIDMEHSHSLDYMSMSDNQGHIAQIAEYIATPTHITAFWRTYGKNNNGRRDSSKDIYHRLSANLDPKLMEAKIQTMRGYYQNYHRHLGRILVKVNNNKLSVSYTIFCGKGIDDCRPIPNADPNHWVTDAPNRNTDLVLLFQGKGESSNTPYPDGPDYNKGRPYVLKSPKNIK